METSQRKIDALLGKAMKKAESIDAKLEDMLDVLKVAITWEKVKNGLNEDEEGSFFNTQEPKGKPLKESTYEDEENE